MNNIKISVIMPSLNMIKYIDRCLESVLGQTLHEIEVLCVDAGSTDGTIQRIEYFRNRDDRLYLINSPVKSYGYQINMALKKAKGDYIAIVDTDDFIESIMFEKLYLGAANTDYPDVVKCGHNEFGEINGKIIKWEVPSKTNRLNTRLESRIDRQVFFDTTVGIWTKIYRRDFLLCNEITLNESKGASYQDTGLMFQVAAFAKSMTIIDGYYYNYRIDNPGSSVKQDSNWDAIYNEVAFINKRLENVTKSDYDLKDRLKKLKVVLYVWNYNRLSLDCRRLFSDKVRSDVQLLYEDRDFYDSLDLNLQEGLRQLLATEHLETEAERQRGLTIKVLRKMAQSRTAEYVVVSAGMMCDSLLFYQSLLSDPFIADICDNDKNKQGRKKSEYTIQSVYTVVNKNKQNDVFCIANCHSYMDIKKQLIELNVPEERILPQITTLSKRDLLCIAKGIDI